MRYFNTSGPNIIEQHYTLIRTDLIANGLRKVQNDRYFTIWAPRQTGKSTYFHQLSTKLEEVGYQVAHVNFENDKESSLEIFMSVFVDELEKFWQIKFGDRSMKGVFHQITRLKDKKLVLIIDEVVNYLIFQMIYIRVKII